MSQRCKRACAWFDESVSSYIFISVVMRLNGVMHLYDVYVCMYRMTNGRLEVRIFFTAGWSNTPLLILPNYLWSSSSVSDILIHFSLIHWRILMPCRRPRFTKHLTIPYITLIIIIHVGWIKYLSSSFYSTRI